MGLRFSCSSFGAPAGESPGNSSVTPRRASFSSRCPIAPGPLHRGNTNTNISAESVNIRSSVSGFFAWNKSTNGTPKTLKTKAGSRSQLAAKESLEPGAASTLASGAANVGPSTPTGQRRVRRHSWTESTVDQAAAMPAKSEQIRVNEVQLQLQVQLPSPVILAVTHKRMPFSLAPSITLTAPSCSSNNSPSAQPCVSDSPSLGGLNLHQAIPTPDRSPSTKPLAMSPAMEAKRVEEKITKVAKITPSEARHCHEATSYTPDASKTRKLFGFITRRRSSSLAGSQKPGDLVSVNPSSNAHTAPAPSPSTSSLCATASVGAASATASSTQSVSSSGHYGASPSLRGRSGNLQSRSLAPPAPGSSVGNNASFVQRMKEKLDDLRPLMAAFSSFPELPHQIIKKNPPAAAASMDSSSVASLTADEELIVNSLQCVSAYVADHGVTVHFRLHKLFRLSLVHPKHSVALTALLFASGAIWDHFASEFPDHCSFLLWLFGNATEEALDFLFPSADSPHGQHLSVAPSPTLSPSLSHSVVSSTPSSASSACSSSSLPSSSSAPSQSPMSLSVCAALPLVCRALSVNTNQIPVPPLSYYHLSAVNSSNQNLLHLAILLPAPESQPTRRCCTRVLTYVVDRLGAIDINATAGNLCTPLHYAASFHRDYAIEKLLELDARTDLRECAIGCRAEELVDCDSYYDPIRAMFASHRQLFADYVRRKRRAEIERALLWTRLRDEFLIISQYDSAAEEDLQTYYQEFAQDRKQQRRAAEKLKK